MAFKFILKVHSNLLNIRWSVLLILELLILISNFIFIIFKFFFYEKKEGSPSSDSE